MEGGCKDGFFEILATESKSGPVEVDGYGMTSGQWPEGCYV